MSTTAPARALHLLLVLSLAAAGCGASVTPAPEGGDAGSLPPDAPSAQAFSQRYATLGDEDLSVALGQTPTAPQAEAALAGLSDR